MLFLAIIPYAVFRAKGYSREALNLKSNNLKNDTLVILVIMAIGVAFDLAGGGFLKLSAHQMLFGGALTFVTHLLGTGLPVMVFIYAILFPRYLKLTSSAATTVVLGALSYAALHIFEYWTLYDCLSDALLSIIFVAVTFFPPGLMKSYLTLRTANAWVHLWGYHAITPPRHRRHPHARPHLQHPLTPSTRLPTTLFAPRVIPSLPRQAKRGRAFHFSPAAYYYSYMYLLFLTMSLDPATLLHVPSTQALSCAPNSFRICRSEKSVCNSFRMRRSILHGLKVLYNEHFQKRGGGVGSVMANFVTARKYSPRAALPFFPLAALSLLIGLALVPDTLAQATSATVAATPPMGWNSWNKFGCNVSDKLIREIADAVVSAGMKDAGYQFVNIDDCWQVSRAADGTIVVDPQRFPNGMKPLADYIHSKGLKFGVYTDAGRLTCEKRPGSYQHEEQDIKTYAEWGVDYVKIDWCAAEGLDPEVQYPKFRDAIAQSGRAIVFSICNWGVKAPWTWGPRTGNLWRTTGDISDKYASMSLIGFSQDGLEKFAGPGHWNDPDMLEVGNGGMKHDEYLTHMALWAILAAPLLAGNDIRTMSEETKSILLNPEVIAVDQDAKGVQGHRVWDEGPLEIWVKPLADGSQAVGLFNRGESALKMTLDLNKIGAPSSAKLRDLWQRKDLGTVQNSYTSEVPKHGVVLLRVSK